MKLRTLKVMFQFKFYFAVSCKKKKKTQLWVTQLNFLFLLLQIKAISDLIKFMKRFAYSLVKLNEIWIFKNCFFFVHGFYLNCINIMEGKTLIHAEIFELDRLYVTLAKLSTTL